MKDRMTLQEALQEAEALSWKSADSLHVIKLRKVKELLEKVFSQWEWVSVEDSLPKVGEEVLVYSQSQIQSVMCMVDDRHYGFTWHRRDALQYVLSHVLYWRPLPPAPEGKQK